MTNWKSVQRPGYFGRRRDQYQAEFNANYGHGNWRIVHVVNDVAYDFEEACRCFYEEAYFQWFKDRPEDVDHVCSFGECIDNAPTNVLAGTDYTHQEAYSNHIQDIVVRNVLKRLDRQFEGPKDTLLIIRSSNSNGYRYGPGNIPFHKPELVRQPPICPRWANPGSVEEFWQSNKILQVKT